MQQDCSKLRIFSFVCLHSTPKFSINIMHFNQTNLVNSFSVVVPDVFNGGSLQRVHLQHEHQQRGHGAGQVLRDVENPSSDLLEQRGDVLIVKGQRATQQRVQDHPTAPDVDLWACVQSSQRDGNTL